MTRHALPNRMFAAGEEPVGVRVTAYHKPRGIAAVINALEEGEVDYLRQSSFGKFISLAEKPCFSGRFARFLISRQLKVNKKHEIWILFAGKPIRVSLREFAIVTGLPCGEYPPKSKKKLKNRISENSNWASLFGTLKQVSVKNVIRMLKNKTVTDKDTRLKYACLALLDSVLLPTTHHHKIDPDHAESIRDLDDFFSYPWGRLSFDMMMTSIKERNEISLTQNTLAIKGFIHALQLIIVAAVPRLTEDGQVQSFSSSESDDDDDSADEKAPLNTPKVTLNPAHARNLHVQRNVPVSCIIPQDDEHLIDETCLGWKDELSDMKVENLVRLIKAGHVLSDSLFTGGSTKSDVSRMRIAAKEEKERLKSVKGKSVLGTETCGNRNDDVHSELPSTSFCVATPCPTNNEVILEKRMQQRLDTMNQNIVDMHGFLSTMKAEIISEIGGRVSELGNTMMDRMITQIKSGSLSSQNCDNSAMFTGTTYSQPKIDGNSGFNVFSSPTFAFTNAGIEVPIQINKIYPLVSCPPPTFSLGLSDESDGGSPCSENGIEVHCTYASTGTIRDPPSFTVHNGHELNINKKQKLCINGKPSGRGSNLTVIPVTEGGCHASSSWQQSSEIWSKFQHLEAKLNTPFYITVGSMYLTSEEVCDIVYRKSHLKPHTVDVLMEHTRMLFNKRGCPLLMNGVQIHDTGFVSLLMAAYRSLKSGIAKDSHTFPDYLLRQMSTSAPITVAPQRFYFPFNFDKLHWVGVCVDILEETIYVLDCHTAFFSDWRVKDQLKPIAVVFPYLLQHVYGRLGSNGLTEFSVHRVDRIPQNKDCHQSGLTTILLLQAHALAGPSVCHAFTPEVVDLESKRLAVSLFEMSGEELLIEK